MPRLSREMEYASYTFSGAVAGVRTEEQEQKNKTKNAKTLNLEIIKSFCNFKKFIENGLKFI